GYSRSRFFCCRDLPEPPTNTSLHQSENRQDDLNISAVAHERRPARQPGSACKSTPWRSGSGCPPWRPHRAQGRTATKPSVRNRACHEDIKKKLAAPCRTADPHETAADLNFRGSRGAGSVYNRKTYF